MIGGVTVFSGGGNQPSRTDKTDQSDKTNETETTSGDSTSTQSQDTGGTTAAEDTGATQSGAADPVAQAPASGDTAPAASSAQTFDAAPRDASADADAEMFVPEEIGAAGGSMRAAAREMRMETEDSMQIQSMSDPVFGGAAAPAAPAPILNIVYNDGVAAANPPEASEILNIIG